MGNRDSRTARDSTPEEEHYRPPGSDDIPAGHSPRLDEYEGHRALLVDGVIFSVAVGPETPGFGYWAAMLPQGSPRTALILGLGGGTLAHLLTRQTPGVRITGVDINPEIIEFARRHFDLDLPNLEVIVADAFDYVSGCTRQFDYVAVDLFQGAAFHRGVLARRFLRRLAGLAGPEGDIVINLYRDHWSDGYLQRIGRILEVVRSDRLACNVVLHCRSRPGASEPE